MKLLRQWIAWGSLLGLGGGFSFHAYRAYSEGQDLRAIFFMLCVIAAIEFAIVIDALMMEMESGCDQ